MQIAAGEADDKHAHSTICRECALALRFQVVAWTTAGCRTLDGF